MSRWSLAKKLSPAKKAWKSFTTSLQPKLHKLIKHIQQYSLPKDMKTTCRRLLSVVAQKLRTISINKPHILFSNSRRRRSTTSNYHYYNNKNNYYNSWPSFSAVHIDDLFAAAAAATTTNITNDKKNNIIRCNNDNMHAINQVGTSRNTENIIKGKGVVDDQDYDHDHHNKHLMMMKRSKSSKYSVEDTWRAVVASSPHLRGVDERAEDFISNFRRQIKLQKEKSILEFQQMLDRSA